MGRYRLNPEQIKYIGVSEQTNLSIKLSRHEDLATLAHPDAFPKANFERIQRQLREDAKQGLSDIVMIFNRLTMFEHEGKTNSKDTSKYIDEILTSKQFTDFMENYYYHLGSDKVPVRERANEFAAQQFAKSLAVLVRSMPVHFKTLLVNSLQPFIELFDAIVDYDNEVLESMKPISQQRSKETRENKFRLKLDPLIDPKQRNKICL